MPIDAIIRLDIFYDMGLKFLWEIQIYLRIGELELLYADVATLKE